MRKIISERLEEERIRIGKKKGEMALIGGVVGSAYTNYITGDRAPDADFLIAIAGAGADVQYILTGIRSSTALSPDEQMLIAGYRALDARGKAGVFGVIGGLTQAPEPAVSKRGGIVIHGDVGQQFDTQTAKTITINMPNKTK